MPGPAPGLAFPALFLSDLEGVPRPLEAAWAGGPALVLIGHRDCRTTRETLPHVDRIARRCRPGSGVVAVLQDDAPSALGLAAQLGLALPLRVEADPYPLAAALDLVAVPTLLLVGPHGMVESVCEGFRRSQIEAMAARLGVAAPVFDPSSSVPEHRPG